jgi:hypothetical protein
MTWIRIDADMPWNDKVTGLPNDTARFAFVKVLCAAKVRGRSAFSHQSLREALGSHAKAIPALIAAGLLEEDGSVLTVHNFEEYQRLALQADRQRRYRERHASVTETSPTGRNGTGRDVTPSIFPPKPERQSFMGWKPNLDEIERQHEESRRQAAEALEKRKVTE